MNFNRNWVFYIENTNFGINGVIREFGCKSRKKISLRIV